MATYRDEAIVLRHQPVGEADVLITFLTAHHGKVIVLAKGLKKITSKLAGHVQPLTHVEVLLAEGKQRDRLAGAEAHDYYPLLHGHLAAVAVAQGVGEIIDRFLVLDEAAPEVYQAALTVIQTLEQRAQSPGVPIRDLVVITLWGIVQVLEHAGLTPEYERTAIDEHSVQLLAIIRQRDALATILDRKLPLERVRPLLQLLLEISEYHLDSSLVCRSFFQFLLVGQPRNL